MTDTKIFFGLPSSNLGGFNARSKRMINHFGNSYLPDIVYFGSYWGRLDQRIPIQLKKYFNLKLVMNQNGIYYPGWFPGDWKKKNADLVYFNSAADEVVYQSNFCKSSLSFLTQSDLAPGIIIHNTAPKLIDDNFSFKTNLKRYVLVNSVFNDDADHILEPIITVFEKLGRNSSYDVKLRLAGHFTNSAKSSDWYDKLSRRIQNLVDAGVCEYFGSYKECDLKNIFSDIVCALHTKYKDPCPNAVSERMQFGIPHVYSNSGGTPELIGNAGVKLDVDDRWDVQVPVCSSDLLNGIESVCNNHEIYSKRALRSYDEKLSWDKYVESHEKLFSKLCAVNKI